MATFWSNPTPDLAHTAAAMAPEALHFADIGGIVGAIMRMKEGQAEQKRQEQKELIQGIGNVAAGTAKTYTAWGEAKGKTAMADYMSSYMEGKRDPSSMGVAQADMDARLAEMTPEQRIMIQQWQQSEDDKNKSPFITGPGGQQFYRTSHGVQPVTGGATQPGFDYFEEGGKVFKRNNKTQAVTSVPAAEADEYKKQKDTLEKAQGLPTDDLLKSDVSTPYSTMYMRKGTNEALSPEDAAKDPTNAEVLLPTGRRMPYRTTVKVGQKEQEADFPDLVPQIEKTQAAKRAVESVPARFKARTSGASTAFGGGIDQQAAAIKAQYKSGQLTKEAALEQLHAIGMD